MESLGIAKQIFELFFAYRTDTHEGIPIWKDDGFWVLTIGLIGGLIARATGVHMAPEIPTLFAGYIVAIVTDLCGPTVGLYRKGEPKPLTAEAQRAQSEEKAARETAALVQEHDRAIEASLAAAAPAIDPAAAPIGPDFVPVGDSTGVQA